MTPFLARAVPGTAGGIFGIAFHREENLRLRYFLRSFVRHYGEARGGLAGLCLALSIAVYMLLIALESGAGRQMRELLGGSGARLLTFDPALVEALPGREGGGAAPRAVLRQRDVEVLRQQCSGECSPVPVASGTRRLEFRELDEAVMVTGTTPGYFGAMSLALARGRFPDELDEGRRARVVVLGARTARRLFGERQESVLTEEQVLGRRVLLGGAPFTVIGVLEAKGTGVGGVDQDDSVYLPLATTLRRLFNQDYLSRIFVEAPAAEALPSLRESLGAQLRLSHAAGDFTLLDSAAALQALESSSGFLVLFFRGLVGLTSLMSATGIYALAYFMVRERRGEIGLRMALGARRRDILALILGETLLLGALAGAAGLLLGAALVLLFTRFTQWAMLVGIEAVVKPLLAAPALSLAVSLGPAWLAARMRPARALDRT